MSLIISNAYLSQPQMTDNAQYIADYLFARGWTQNAIAGILGNMQRESTMNPGLWESLIYGNMSGGYGLVQWTPATGYTSWADARGYPWGNNYGNTTAYFNGQLECILWEVANNQQWIATSSFNFSFSAFTKSTQAPEYLAEAFMRNYERPGVLELEESKQNARYWYNNLTYGTSRIEDVVQLVLSRVGKNTYTNDWNLRQRVFDEPTGYSDCSSLMWKAFERGAGIQIGTWTGEQMEQGDRVWYNPDYEDVFSLDMQRVSGAQRGDLVFWGPNDSPDASTHVEMYLGNDQFAGHGSGIGPRIKTASTYIHTGKLVEVRRYLSGGVTPPPFTGVSLVRWIPG